MASDRDGWGGPLDVGAQTWRPLRVLNLYRLTVAGSLTVIDTLGLTKQVLGFEATPTLYLLSVVYLMLSLIYIFTITNAWPDFKSQVVGQTMLDVVIIGVFISLAGGLDSGLGVLMVISVAGGSLLLSGSASALFAASATLVILAIEYVLMLRGVSDVATVSKSGMLGLVFFAAAALANLLSRRAREQEVLAQKRELDLENLNQLNQEVIEHLQSGVLVVDEDLRVHSYNSRAREMCRVHSLDAEPMLGAISPTLAEQVALWRDTGGANVATAFRVGGSTEEVVPRITALGNERSVGYLIVLEDAAVLYEEAQSVRMAALGQLSASIAHEIRNPVGAISHAAQLLEPRDDTDQQRLAEIIRDNCDRVSDVIQNVLDLYRHSGYQETRIGLAEWLPNAVDRATVELGVSARSVVIEPTDLCLSTDEVTLQQILAILVVNAGKHAVLDDPSGATFFDVIAGVESDRFNLDVIDNGPGIAATEAQRVFEPFYSTHADGSGLGLYIASQLAASIGGYLKLMDVEQGAYFRLSLPSRKISLATSPPASLPNPQGDTE